MTFKSDGLYKERTILREYVMGTLKKSKGDIIKKKKFRFRFNVAAFQNEKC